MIKKVLHITFCLAFAVGHSLKAETIDSARRFSLTYNVGISEFNRKVEFKRDSINNIPPIDTVFIKVQRSDFASVGRFKSVINNELQTGLLHERLTENATFFKQYGVSGSSTVSKRGADATQTQVVWNGLPINHPMLGMTDFNGISSFAFSEIFIIEGGNSALFGSGSVGGTIFLNNQSQFEAPLKISV